MYGKVCWNALRVALKWLNIPFSLGNLLSILKIDGQVLQHVIEEVSG